MLGSRRDDVEVGVDDIVVELMSVDKRLVRKMEGTRLFDRARRVGSCRNHGLKG